ncbi:hypothetical protein AB1L88_22825 [Tautonia sp. JC769]|uniref:hypothetical protein n=1 Tax=Tautonia sp. JC769 TaxID=3232135 RepID=UPI00345A2297
MVSALPFALLSSLYFFAVRAAFYLGHWPYYGHPDPKDLPPDLPCEWLKYAGPPAVLALQVVASRPLVGRCRDYGGRLLLAFAMFPASLMLCFALLVSDPVGVLDWFMD